MSARLATQIENIASLALETFDSISYKDLDLAYSCLRQNLVSKICELLEEEFVSPGTNVKLQYVRDRLQQCQTLMDETAKDRYDRGPVQTKLSIRRIAESTAKLLVEILENNEMQQLGRDSLQPCELSFGYPDGDVSAFQENKDLSDDEV